MYDIIFKQYVVLLNDISSKCCKERSVYNYVYKVMVQKDYKIKNDESLKLSLIQKFKAFNGPSFAHGIIFNDIFYLAVTQVNHIFCVFFFFLC